MITLIKKIILNYRVKKAIKQAVEFQKESGRKHLVVMCNGKPMVHTKQKLQYLIKTRYFKKGTRIQDLEKAALFITK